MYQYIHAGPNILHMFLLTNILIYDIIPQNLNAGGVHMDNEKNLKDEFKKADIESINLWHHREIRTATINDLEAVAAVEAECFPAAEAATKEEFAERIKFYGDHFWLMFDADKLITIPSYRQHGYAGELIRRAIFDAKAQHRKGLVLTCKDKLIHYYASFGFVDEGISESVHGNVVWHQMRLTF